MIPTFMESTCRRLPNGQSFRFLSRKSLRGASGPKCHSRARSFQVSWLVPSTVAVTNAKPVAFSMAVDAVAISGPHHSANASFLG